MSHMHDICSIDDYSFLMSAQMAFFAFPSELGSIYHDFRDSMVSIIVQ